LDHSTIPATEYFELEGAVQEVAVGDEVVAFGYPHWAPGDRLNQRPGHVSLLTPKSGVRKIEVTQALTQGMSGGPILDVRGQVVGVIYKGGPDEGRQLATDLRELQAWLQQ
jgi:S1-C subfamily serine protease